MSRHTQQPAVLILEPDPNAEMVSPLRRMAESLVTLIRPADREQVAVQATAQPSAQPFAIAHPWRRWHWFS
ncbi:MAG: hypothetical protein H7836_03670 [Magnetococcus sp. YQC-3]